MRTPERTDPEGDKDAARRFAGRQVQKANEAKEAADAALAFAYEAGNSLRELEAETGISYRTISRIVERQNDSDEPGEAESS